MLTRLLISRSPRAQLTSQYGDIGSHQLHRPVTETSNLSSRIPECDVEDCRLSRVSEYARLDLVAYADGLRSYICDG